MTLQRMILGMFVLTTLLTGSVFAGVIQSFDGDRDYYGANQYYLTGNGMVLPYNQLIANGHSVSTHGLDHSCGP